MIEGTERRTNLLVQGNAFCGSGWLKGKIAELVAGQGLKKGLKK